MDMHELATTRSPALLKGVEVRLGFWPVFAVLSGHMGASAGTLLAT